MSFKSKQRAKHGHLFGDDPLSASLVSTSDDPLFGPKKTTTTATTKSTANDPLSQLINSDSNPLETNSTPISPTSTRRKANGNLMTHSHSSSSSSHSGSIFGDIDVSKLGTGNGFNSSKKVNNTSLRSSATLKSSKLNLDEEEDLLFGGHRHSPSKSKLSQKSATTSSSPSPVLSPSPLNNSTPKKSPVLPTSELPVEQPTLNIPQKMEQPIPPPESSEITKKEESVKREEKPTVSSSTSSFFKFFKSSNSKTSSSASSAASVNAASPIIKNDDAVINNNTTTATTAAATTTTTITNNEAPSLPTPRETKTPPKQTNIYKNIKHSITKEKPIETKNEEEEEEEQEDTRPEIILDEATRAFAEDDLFTSPKSSRYDYRSLVPEMDALTVNTDSNKKLNTSISTPTRVDDPWSEIPVSQNFAPEPSMSSPLVVKVQDIEPQKRSAFADLIQSWNTGNSTNQEFSARENDPDTFYDHIAEERRDIAFAGIEDTARDNHSSSLVDWDVQEDNPWN